MRLVKFIKRLLVMSAIRRLSLHLTRGIPRVIMYHRFCDGRAMNRMSKETFEWQIGVIRKDFRVTSLAGLLDPLTKGGSGEAPVVITIDDAYMDFYDIAFPLLIKNGMTATLFVSTGFVDSKRWFWWDALRFVLAERKGERKTYCHNELAFCIDTGTEIDADRTWNLLADYCLGAHDSERSRFIGEFASFMGVSLPAAPLPEYDQMGWDHILEVSRNGVEIGSHTVNHEIMTRLGNDEKKEELELSKDIIEKRLGEKVRTFSYPNGKRRDYDRKTMDLLRRLGYIGAVVSHEGIYFSGEPYAIPRYSVSDDRVDFYWKLYGMDCLVKKIAGLLGRSAKVSQ